MRPSLIKQGLAIRRTYPLRITSRPICFSPRSLTPRRTRALSNADVEERHRYVTENQDLPRDGAQQRYKCLIEGTCHFTRGAVAEHPEYFAGPDVFKPLPINLSMPHPRPLALLALSFLHELRRLEPGSVRRTVEISTDKWRLDVDSRNASSKPHRNRYFFSLTIYDRKKTYRHDIKFRMQDPRDSTLEFHLVLVGEVNSQRFPKLNFDDLDKLADTIMQHGYEIVYNPAHDLKQEVFASEIANIAASELAAKQQDLLLNGCHVFARNHPSCPALSSFFFFGDRDTDSERSELLRAEGKSRFFVALGSNVGNRLGMIERACLELQNEGIQIVRTSGLWETKAMYVEDQANFLNGVCEVTSMDQNPEALLIKLKSIEDRLGRVKLIEKGPRSIDLDVLLWNHEAFEKESPELPISVPHKLMLEREFVLRPLCELIPRETLPSPSPPFTFETHLQRLLVKEELGSNETFSTTTASMSTQVELSPSLPPLSPLFLSRKTQVMSILNLTPDSFSDGGINNPAEMDTLSSTITAHLAYGATIIDIGGQTSRPGAVSITAEEEISRIIPAIRFLKEYEASNPNRGLAISIDTYRASVAKQAIEAGAHIINDISAGLLDPDMFSTVAKLGCTYILMHMRGTPETMTSKGNTTYDGDLIQIVGSELLTRVRAAEAAGIRRWRMILDPGIGFAKNLQQNLELLRRLGELRDFPGLQGIPWLVGTSRKGFIGKITDVGVAGERMLGTAATVTAAVQGGADIVRVHDVKEMGEVVRMSDALYRGWVEDK